MKEIQRKLSGELCHQKRFGFVLQAYHVHLPNTTVLKKKYILECT